LYLITTTEDGDDVAQVTIVSLEDPQEVDIVTGESDDQLSTYDPGHDQNKFTPIVWHDPVTDDDLLIMRQSFPEATEASEIAIWRKTGINAWVHYLTLTPEDIGEEDLDVILSPEPFVFDDQSYIVFSTSDDLFIDNKTDGNIWVARLANGNPPSIGVDWSRQVNTRPTSPSPQAVRRRIEGEVYILTDGSPVRPIIYYTMIEDRINDDDINCDYFSAQGLENNTLRRAEVCPPTVSGGPCSVE
jgi:hypothetical protein